MNDSDCRDTRIKAAVVLIAQALKVSGDILNDYSQSSGSYVRANLTAALALLERL